MEGLGHTRIRGLAEGADHKRGSNRKEHGIANDADVAHLHVCERYARKARKR